MNGRSHDAMVERTAGTWPQARAPRRDQVGSRRREGRLAAQPGLRLAATVPECRPGLFAALDLAGRSVVVIGGGTGAQERLGPLLAARADVRVIAPWLTPAIESLVASGLVQWHPREYRTGDLAGAWLAMVGTQAPEVERLVTAEARRARIFCIGLEDPGGGSLHPAPTATSDGSTVAVLGPDFDRASAGLVAVQRGMRSKAVAMPVRNERTRPGVVLLGGGPGDPQLLTVLGRELLRQADTVVVDESTPGEVLDDLESHVEVIDVSQSRRGYRALRSSIHETLIARARAGNLVVHVSGGDPLADGTGYEEMTACHRAGVPVTVVSGVSSAAAAISRCRSSAATTFAPAEVGIVSAHLPPGHGDNLVDWTAVARMRGATVLLGAVPHMAQIAPALVEGGRRPETPVVVAEEATSRRERILHATLDDVADLIKCHGIGPRATVVVEGPMSGADARTAQSPPPMGVNELGGDAS